MPKRSEKLINNLKRAGRGLKTISVRFIDDDCFTSAAALSYSTILSMVPFMAVLLMIASQYSLRDRNIDDFIFKHFIPNSALAEVIKSNVAIFVSKAGTIGMIGLIFLVVSSVSLIINIEGAFSKIFRGSKKRSVFKRVVVFFGVILVAPILITLSIVATAGIRHFIMMDWIIELPAIQEALLRVVPFIFTGSAFFLLYKVIPNTYVKTVPALIGAIIAGSLFEWAKLGFDFYLTYYALTYSKIYGAIAAIPILLIWIYLSWVTILFGATISCVTQFRRKDDLKGEHGRREGLRREG